MNVATLLARVGVASDQRAIDLGAGQAGPGGHADAGKQRRYIHKLGGMRDYIFIRKGLEAVLPRHLSSNMLESVLPMDAASGLISHFW